MALLEIACFNVPSALIAHDAGADRIELCADATVGGTTPDFVALQRSRNEIMIPVFVMIRPRGGDFSYTDTEFEQMRSQIRRFKPLVNGFVFGILDPYQNIDRAKCSELIALADPLPCTFHRAFDLARDKVEALEQVIASGFKAVLTSGGATNAVDGADTLQQLVKQADGRLDIVLGGCVRSSNVRMLRQRTNATTFHSSALTSDTTHVEADEVRRLKSMLEYA